MIVYIAAAKHLTGNYHTIRGVFSTKAYAREFLDDDPVAIDGCRVPPYDPNIVLAMEVDRKKLDATVGKLYRAEIHRCGDHMEIEIVKELNEDRGDKVEDARIYIDYDRRLEMNVIVLAGNFDAARKRVIQIRDKLIESGQWIYTE